MLNHHNRKLIVLGNVFCGVALLGLAGTGVANATGQVPTTPGTASVQSTTVLSPGLWEITHVMSGPMATNPGHAPNA
jgi:hypothetical protein